MSSMTAPISVGLAADVTDKGTDDLDDFIKDASISTGAVMLRSSSSRRSSSFLRKSDLSVNDLSSFFCSLAQDFVLYF